jgi:hypothetical protein
MGFSAVNGNSLFFNPLIYMMGYLPDLPSEHKIPFDRQSVDSLVYSLP